MLRFTVLLLCAACAPRTVVAAGTDSKYAQLGSDVLVTGVQTLLSTVVNGGQLVHLQSDGRFYPASPTGPSSVYITVDGTRVGNYSVIDFEWGTTNSGQHSFEVVGATMLASGQHTVALMASANGSFYVGAGSNLSVVTQPAANFLSESLSSDTGALYPNIPSTVQEGQQITPPQFGSGSILTSTLYGDAN